MDRCVECGGAVETKINQRYRYVESCLRNVWLNGITVHRCKSCGTQYPEIPDIQRVHGLIADAITEKSFALTGPEFRFLRKQMRMKAKDLATFLGVTTTTVSRWETGAKRIGASNDRLMRSFYLFWRLKQDQVAEPSRLLDEVRSLFGGLKATPKSETINLPSTTLETVPA